MSSAQTRGLRWALSCLCLGASLAAAGPLQQVTLQLKWNHQFQFAGYYAAQEKGYYREAGLEVKVVPADPAISSVQEVVAGRAQYGISDSSLLLARHQGLPVVVLGVVFQHSALELVARTGEDLQSIHDLVGKRVMLEREAGELLAYLRKEGIPEIALGVTPHALAAEALAQGRTDAISAYSTDENFYLDQAGYRYLTFTPRAGGIDFYGDNLFTTESELRAHPDRVKAFRAASLKGWQYAMQHPEELVELILKRYGARHSREHLLFEARHMAPLVQAETVDVGYMYPGRWQHIATSYSSLGLLPEAFSLEGFLYDPGQADRLLRHRLFQGFVAALIAGALLAGAALVFLGWNRHLKRELLRRERMEAELKERDRKFRFLAEHAGDVIWTMDLATQRFTFINASVLALRGYTPEEIMAMPFDASMTEESGQRMRSNLVEAIAQWEAGEREAYWVTEVDQPHRDGHLVPTEVVTTLHADAEGRLDSILGVSRDITRRREAELSLREAMRNLEQLAGTDPLTGAWNRRRFDEAIIREIHRSERYHQPLSIMLLDIDHFKVVNDTYGHPEGDKVLRQVAEVIRGVVRISDALTRWGGEEFVVLMPNTERSQALILAERVRQGIAEHAFPGLPGVTVSIGVAEHVDGAPSAEWLDRADRAMYLAKNQGRNRVVLDPLATIAPPSGGHPGRTFLKLVWNPAFRSGHALIDAQHEQLFEHANELLDAVLAERSSADIAEQVTGLLAAVTGHFRDEERILAEFGYPSLTEHTAKHTALVAQAGQLAAAHAAGTLSVGSLFQFLAHDVVSLHMLKADKDFFGLVGLSGAVPS